MKSLLCTHVGRFVPDLLLWLSKERQSKFGDRPNCLRCPTGSVPLRTCMADRGGAYSTCVNLSRYMKANLAATLHLLVCRSVRKNRKSGVWFGRAETSRGANASASAGLGRLYIMSWATCSKIPDIPRHSVGRRHSVDHPRTRCQAESSWPPETVSDRSP